MGRLRIQILVWTSVVVAFLAGINDAVFTRLTDLRFENLHRSASGQVVFVTIDTKSIGEVGVWPWPRKLHAKLVERLVKAGASDIAFDIDFSSQSRPDDDNALARALKLAGGSVILPAFKQFQPDLSGRKTIKSTFPLDKFRQNSWPATVNVRPETNGQIRYYSFGQSIQNDFVPSMGAMLTGAYKPDGSRFLIDFSISPASIPTYSYIDVLTGRVAAKQLKGKKVLVGGSAAELGDRFYVPKVGTISGAALQIVAAESIIQGRTLQKTSVLISLIGLFLLSMLWLMLPKSVTVFPRIVLAVSIALACELGAFGLQATAPVIVDTTALLIAIFSYVVLTLFNEIGLYKVITSLAQRRFQVIARSLGDGIVCTDEHGIITFWNKGAEAIFGYRSDEMLGTSINRLSNDVEIVKQLELSATAPDAEGCPDEKRCHAVECTSIRATGEALECEFRVSSWRVGRELQFGVVARDITARKKEEDRVRFLAEHDTLTGLANRNKFNEIFASAVAHSKASQTQLAVILIDLDDFKEVNDTLGHQAGDTFLTAIGKTLQSCVPEFVIARMGGDEFAIVLTGPNIQDVSADVATRIRHALQQLTLVIASQTVSSGASIGISIYPNDGDSPEMLLANADLALYRAKSQRRNGYCFYSEDLRQELVLRRALEEELETAVANNQFELFYQPQLDLKSRKIAGAEALIRWHHPVRGLIAPDQFLAVLNAGPLSARVASWVLETAATQARAWELAGYPTRVSVNISPSEFKNKSLPSRVETLLQTSGLSPSLLELEITEETLIVDDELANDVLEQIRGLNVGIAVDDFGTGYASLSYLKRFPLERLKIDRSFVRDILSDRTDLAIARAITDLCKAINLKVIAEGIEDEASAALLQQLGCNEGQGYHFGHPVPADEFTRILVGQTCSSERRANIAS